MTVEVTPLAVARLERAARTANSGGAAAPAPPLAKRPSSIMSTLKRVMSSRPFSMRRVLSGKIPASEAARGAPPRSDAPPPDADAAPPSTPVRA